MKIQQQIINSALSWKRISLASHKAPFTFPIGGSQNIGLYMYRYYPIPQTVCPELVLVLLKNVSMKIQKQIINSTLSWKRISQATHIALFTSPISGTHNMQLYMYRSDPIPQTV